MTISALHAARVHLRLQERAVNVDLVIDLAIGEVQAVAQQGQPVVFVERCTRRRAVATERFAATLLSDDATRLVSSFMPCRISIYERGDGSVVISRMNAGLVSRLFRGRVAEVMAVATEETQTLINRVLGYRSGAVDESKTLSVPSHG